MNPPQNECNPSASNTLLIIDDEPQALSKYRTIFASSFSCITADQASKGLEIYYKVFPAVVLCDVKLPGELSGIDLCKKIKATNPETIVVLISVYNDTKTRLEGFEARADEYIDKLMSDKEIKYRVNNFYSTKNNLPADFSTDLKNTPLDQFEHTVNAILADYYNNPPHLREKMSLDFLKQKLNKETRTLQREFKKYTQKTFSEYHNTFKLTLARNWLLKTDSPIEAISEKLNYYSPSHFSRYFKSRYGITPSHYRLNHDK